ncbi:TnsA endonuclease N-terminal domain-containing protein [Marinobacter changyiensis]|uniref:TnsA endonuclease N-terminal domain-containing protein n=1 Tax=Marinobacter changyiensis TaxID=2604091 RepID=UPI0012645C80|nr:TnsA endonuclease N-terminal domain-containing protein [Marinobacter changyiensis]
MRLPENPNQEVSVSTASLTPCQHKTKLNLRVATDFRVAQMLKHPHPCEFHSIAEYYHAALLEGDPAVTQYVPQPFMLKIGKRRRYVPDCYVVRDGQVDVVELKPRAEFDEDRRQALEAFFRIHRMRFVVIPNEAILTRRTEACNWLMILQMLVCHQDLDTTQWEQELLETVIRYGGIRFGDRVSRSDRDSSRPQEIALLRLLHQGKLTANLANDRFGYDTELEPCH